MQVIFPLSILQLLFDIDEKVTDITFQFIVTNDIL